MAFAWFMHQKSAVFIHEHFAVESSQFMKKLTSSPDNEKVLCVENGNIQEKPL